MNIYKYNRNARYSPNHGSYLERLTASDLTIQKIIVDQSDHFFIARFPNIFQDYEIEGTQSIISEWNAHPFSLWRVQLNFVVFCATSACGISMEHLTNKDYGTCSVFVSYLFPNSQDFTGT